MSRRNDENKFKPLEVSIRSNENIERMIRRFTKAVRNDGILQEFTDRRHHVKNSTKRRKKRQMAKWNARIDTRK